MILIMLLTSGVSIARDEDEGRGRTHRGAVRGGHVRGEHVEKFYGESGFFVDSPFSRPDFYYWPYYSFPPYYSSPTIIMPSTPPAYIDQGTAPYTQPLAPSNLDYCSEPAGYYPYVRECPSGWRRIEPHRIEQQPGYWYYCTHPSGHYPSVRECPSIWRNVVP